MLFCQQPTSPSANSCFDSGKPPNCNPFTIFLHCSHWSKHNFPRLSQKPTYLKNSTVGLRKRTGTWSFPVCTARTLTLWPERPHSDSSITRTRRPKQHCTGAWSAGWATARPTDWLSKLWVLAAVACIQLRDPAQVFTNAKSYLAVPTFLRHRDTPCCINNMH